MSQPLVNVDCISALNFTCQITLMGYCEGCFGFANHSFTSNCSSSVDQYLASRVCLLPSSSMTPSPLPPSRSPSPTVTTRQSPSATSRPLPVSTYHPHIPGCCRGLYSERCSFTGDLSCSDVDNNEHGTASWCKHGLMIKFLIIVAVIVTVLSLLARLVLVLHMFGEGIILVSTAVNVTTLAYFESRFVPANSRSRGGSYVMLCFSTGILILLSTRFLLLWFLPTWWPRRRQQQHETVHPIDSSRDGIDLPERRTRARLTVQSNQQDDDEGESSSPPRQLPHHLQLLARPVV